MNKISEIIIIGGGKSIEPHREELIEKLKNRFIIAINYAYKHFPHTFLVYIDPDFYKTTDLTKHPDIYEELKKESLIITCGKTKEKILHPNTIKVKNSNTYNNNPLKKGFYHPIMTGIFALSLAEFFEPEKIFILGYDWGELNQKNKTKPHTEKDIHYYGKEIKHRGIGFVGFFNNHNPNQYFKCFEKSKSKIYNVSPNSNIKNFELIDYKKMFELLSTQTFNQEELRIFIKEKLKS